MADATVNVVDGGAIVVPLGADAVAPLVTLAGGYADAAAASASGAAVDAAAVAADRAATEASATSAAGAAATSTAQAVIATAQAVIATTKAAEATVAQNFAQQYAADAAMVSGVNVPIYTSIATAQAATIAAAVQCIETQFYAPNYAIPGTLTGRRRQVRASLADIVAAGYPASAYFRSTDRYMPDLSTDATNGGYWLIQGRVFTPEQFGALSGSDDTQAVLDAYAMANLFQRTGATADISHPGGTVELSGNVHTLSTLATPIPVECNVVDKGARFIVPTAYAGKAFRLGLNTAGKVLTGAKIDVPELTRATGSVTAGSIGVSFENIYASTITLQRIEWFEKPRACRSLGFGCAYNTIYLGQSSSGSIMFDIVPGTGGWFNANRMIGSNWYMPGVRVAGNYFVNMDGTAGASEIYGNVFISVSMEGQGAEYAVKGKNAIGNTFIGPYMETGSPAVATTVSGSTLTSVAHGLAVGDVLSFAASVLPTGMYDSQAYFVVSTPTADTFTVSLNRGGTAITFSSSGTSVVWYVGMVCYWDGSGGAATRDNTFFSRASPYISPVNHLQAGQALRNGEDNARLRFSEVYSPADIPGFRGRNTFNSTAITRASFAAYPPGTDPQASPTLWTMGLSDRGLIGKNTDGTTAGRLWISSGRVNYESTVGGVAGATRTIPSAVRTLGGPETVGSCIIPANDQYLYTHTLSGIAAGDVPSIGWANDLPVGVGMMWVRVSTTDTLKFCFRNFTGSPIDLAGKQFTACVTAQYY